MNRLVLLLLVAVAARVPALAGDEPASAVCSVQLNPGRVYFVPTHRRVTTTIRFPHEIGAPDGAVSIFTEDAAAHPGEYLVTWQQGDSYFTVTPLKDAQMANLNVPYEGNTYVFYLYPAMDQLRAMAAVNLVGAPAATRDAAAGDRVAAPTASPGSPAPVARVLRQPAPPPDEYVPATPARLLGLMDRLKLIHATPAGPALDAVTTAMNVEVADSPELPGAGAKPSSAIGSGRNDFGLFELVLLRAVRDRRLNAIGFICLLRNTSSDTLMFDVNSFGARAGAAYLLQRLSDAPAVLKPGEQTPAYFIVQPSRNNPLLAANNWRLSVDLVSPRLNPGAMLARGFGRGEGAP